VFPAGGGGGWTVIADVMFSEVADRKFLSTSVTQVTPTPAEDIGGVNCRQLNSSKAYKSKFGKSKKNIEN
jgi:hypothetical protein